jgi:surfactin synthase thioesterase subunit
LEEDLGTPVSVNDLIWGPTINQLVDQLADAFAEIASDKPAGKESAMAAASRPIAAADGHFRVAPEAPEILRSRRAEVQITGGQYRDGKELQQVTNTEAVEINTAGKGRDPDASPHIKINEQTQPARSGNAVSIEYFGTPVSPPRGGAASRPFGKWLIAPQPNPDAKARLFCFPYAGGGLVSFRTWPQFLDDTIEVVTVEPPGRGTRIKETAINDLDTFVERLLPELVDWLDRPSAFFGHCLGGLTMFATLCALPKECTPFIKHSFACGVRPPHLLKRRGDFEDNLIYDMMLHREFDIDVPPYAQSDEIFADIIRQFDLPAADKMLGIPKLRKALMPTIRSEFEMACKYEYRRVDPLPFPISSFVGDSDPWVSEEDSAGWGEFTRGAFTNHLRRGSHFLMADDREYILQTINNQLAA